MLGTNAKLRGEPALYAYFSQPPRISRRGGDEDRFGKKTPAEAGASIRSKMSIKRT